MPDLSFRVVSVEAVARAAAPLMNFGIEIKNAGNEAIHAIVLRCQIQIEAARRQYTREEQLRLGDLFGEPERWSQTLRGMLWTHAQTVVPAFVGTTVSDLLVPCTFDFNVAATKYFHGLGGGEIPLCLMFSGSMFYELDGALAVAPISWSKEARFRLPADVWRRMMEEYYPNSAWLCLRRDAFEQLMEYRRERGMTSWEQAIEDLLRTAQQVAVS